MDLCLLLKWRFWSALVNESVQGASLNSLKSISFPVGVFVKSIYSFKLLTSLPEIRGYYVLTMEQEHPLGSL